jgi:hypothetical protein
MLGDVRNAELEIDFTWLNWIDCSVDYLNPDGYTNDGRNLYYIGSTMEYNLNVENFCWTIYNGKVRTEQRYLGGPKNGELMPGESVEEWLNQKLKHGITVLYDDYYIPWNTLPGNAVTWARVWFPFNCWCIQIDIILYNNACGIWDP